MSNEIADRGEVLLYSDESGKEYVSVVFKDETFWLTQSGMAELFACTADNISLHLKNIYADGELTPEATTEKFSVVRKEGSREVTRLNRLVTMFIDYAELMAEDEQPMSMQDWLNETDRFLTNNRRRVLDGKGHVSREAAAKKVSGIYEEFRKKQDAEYISEFDREFEKYLKGGSK